MCGLLRKYILFKHKTNITNIFFAGASWPAIHPMTAVWIPPMDRSKFIANMMASSLGAALSMPICGFLISYVGWESVFYVTGKLFIYKYTHIIQYCCMHIQNSYKIIINK